MKSSKEFPLLLCARSYNLLLSGKEEEAKQTIQQIADSFAQYDMKLDLDKTLNHFKADIVHSSAGELISIDLRKEDPKIRKSSLIDALDLSVSAKKPTIIAPRNTVKVATPIVQSVDPRIEEESLRTQGHLLLKDIPIRALDDIVNIAAMEVTDSSRSIEFGNVRYGGYGIDIKPELNVELKDMMHANDRAQVLQAYLASENIELALDDIKESNPLALIKKVSEKLKEQILELPKQEAAIEKLSKDITKLLVNNTNIIDDLPYELSSDQQISGRNYLNVGKVGATVNNLFANSNTDAKISTGTLVKFGIADCRGTNMIYAQLLNEGYKSIASTKKSKIIYTKIACAALGEPLCTPADHNIVAVIDNKNKITLRDAYFDYIDGTPLNKALDLSISNSALSPKETHEELKEQAFQFKVIALNPYPPQQNTKAAKKIAQSYRILSGAIKARLKAKHVSTTPTSANILKHSSLKGVLNTI